MVNGHTWDVWLNFGGGGGCRVFLARSVFDDGSFVMRA